MINQLYSPINQIAGYCIHFDIFSGLERDRTFRFTKEEAEKFASKEKEANVLPVYYHPSSKEVRVIETTQYKWEDTPKEFHEGSLAGYVYLWVEIDEWTGEAHPCQVMYFDKSLEFPQGLREKGAKMFPIYY